MNSVILEIIFMNILNFVVVNFLIKFLLIIFLNLFRKVFAITFKKYFTVFLAFVLKFKNLLNGIVNCDILEKNLENYKT